MQQTKLKEAKAMLDAYRCGWLQYDQSHVAQLRAVIAELSKTN